ncbi:hypothetical protein [Nocardia neocaledoniensis]|uniref:hypothetical protein n=1 Tax=Nocardia neocaledoniensis TaxID=236511 RepID=UPI001ABFE9EF|nr:hypothetical protein [Nocardia neocaledoniensis]
MSGSAMIVGPLLLLAAALLRAPFPMFFTHQLAAVQSHPRVMTAAYIAFAAGTVALWPAITHLAADIGRISPTLAVWGGSLVTLGLFTRTFHAGVDQTAFGLVRHHDAEFATGIVAESYADLHLFQFLAFSIPLGWLVLAFGAYRCAVLGRVRAVGLALMCALPLGVLKGTEILSVVALSGLCVALVPTGFELLRQAPRPTPRTIALTIAALAGCIALAVVGAFG